MPRVSSVCLLVLLLLLGEPRDGAAKYASGARRSGHQLRSEESSPLEQHQVTSVTQCLNLCAGQTNCTALNFGSVSATTNCQLLGRRACDGLSLIANAAVDYYDVYDQSEDLTAEKRTPFWDDPGCVQDGYCSADCAAEAAGEFCVVDAHCTAKPPGGHACVDGGCQVSPDFWELRPGLILPRWQPWRMDWHAWTWKKLKPDTCSLDINVKLGVGAEGWIAAMWTDDHAGNRIVFRFTTSGTNLYYHDSTGATHWLAQDVSTPGMVSNDAYSRLKASWCGGASAIGPEDNPTLVSGQATITQPIDFFAVHSSDTASWMYVDSGVADHWLFDDQGVAEDIVMEFRSTYVYRNISATNDVTIKYDCMAETDCVVALQQNTPFQRMLAICVGCWTNQRCGLVYYGDVSAEYLHQDTGPVLSTSEFNTFTVRYNNGFVTVHHNDATVPIYSAEAPHPMTSIDTIGIGGCCGYKRVRIARYDPAWRTDTWLTEGRGYSNGDVLP